MATRNRPTPDGATMDSMVEGSALDGETLFGGPTKIGCFSVSLSLLKGDLLKMTLVILSSMQYNLVRSQHWNRIFEVEKSCI